MENTFYTEWSVEFEKDPTKESLEILPFFSGLRIPVPVIFHVGYKVETSLEDIDISSPAVRIVCREMNIRNLRGLLLIPFYEFLMFPLVDRPMIQATQMRIAQFIFPNTQLVADNNRSGKTLIWVLDSNGLPIKRELNPDVVVDQLAVTEIQPQVEDPSAAEGVRILPRELIRKARFFTGMSGVEIRSATLSITPMETIFEKFSIRFVNVLKRAPQIKSLENLINTNYKDLLRLRNCGVKSISDAQRVLESLKLLDDDGAIEVASPDTSTPDFLVSADLALQESHKYPLLQGTAYQRLTPTESQAMMDLSQLEFPVRFETFLKKERRILKLKDLLKISIDDLRTKPNIGKTTIKEVQDVVIDFLLDENRKHFIPTLSVEPLRDENVFRTLDELIVFKMNAISTSERNAKILLHRYRYRATTRLTLEEIGTELSLTRERVRQIIDRGEKKITKNKIFFSELSDQIRTGPLITDTETIAESLITSGLWSSDNIFFLKDIIHEFLGPRLGFHWDGEKIITVPPDTIKSALSRISRTISEIVSRCGGQIDIQDLVLRIREINADLESEPNKLINPITISYLARTTKRFFLVENRAYSEMQYQIHHGKHLKDVTYWSLKFLADPIHFRQLAEFIRSNNSHFRDIPDQSVHNSLLFSKLIHDVDRGVFALVESNIPKHRTTWEAIVKILRERGPLIEDTIYLLLRNDYSMWSIQMALENNRNKIIRIGNDLIDLKGDHL